MICLVAESPHLTITLGLSGRVEAFCQEKDWIEGIKTIGFLTSHQVFKQIISSFVGGKEWSLYTVNLYTLQFQSSCQEPHRFHLVKPATAVSTTLSGKTPPVQQPSTATSAQSQTARTAPTSIGTG